MKLNTIITFATAVKDFREGWLSTRAQYARVLIDAWRIIEIHVGIDSDGVDQIAADTVEKIEFLVSREGDTIQRIRLTECLEAAQIRLAESIVAAATEVPHVEPASSEERISETAKAFDEITKAAE